MTYAELSRCAIIERKAYKFALTMLFSLEAFNGEQRTPEQQAAIDQWHESAAVALFRMERIYEKMDRWITQKMADANLVPVRVSDDVAKRLHLGLNSDIDDPDRYRIRRNGYPHRSIANRV